MAADREHAHRSAMLLGLRIAFKEWLTISSGEAAVREITLKKYRKGATIVAIGGPATDVYIVVRGQIGISRSPQATELPPPNTLGPGSIFGESALLVGMRYRGYAHAMTDTVCVVIPQEKLPGLANILN